MFRRCSTITLFLTAAIFVFHYGFAQNQNQSSNQNKQTQIFVQPPTLHQWGAVTLFHGLPSDRVRAIAQDKDGVMWFGTDAGLARYDGRRTQAITSEEVPQGRVSALSLDQDGALWIGTEGGAARYAKGQFNLVKETEGRSITAFLQLEKTRTLATSEDGFLFEIETPSDSSIGAKTIPREQLQSADRESPGPLELTSLARSANGKVFFGSRSRGVLTFDSNEIKEVRGEPRAFFIEALEADHKGRLWLGAKTTARGSGLYESGDPLRPKKIGVGLGTVLSLRADALGQMWVGTDGHGVFQFKDDVMLNHFTFDGTAGGLRSNRVYEIFVDREGVVWFGTDRGVSRYDPRALRVEKLSESAESNFIRAVYRTKDKRLYCGTNRGLFVQNGPEGVWQVVSELAQKTVYALSEDANGRLLVGTASGLYVKSDNGFKEIAWPNNETKTSDVKKESEDETSAPNRDLSAKNEESFSDERVHSMPPEESQPKSVTNNFSNNPNDNVRAIVKSQNKIFVAVYGRGVETLEGEARKLVWPKNADDKKLKEINSLFVDAQNRLWIGTASAGVFIFDGVGVKTEPQLAELQNVGVASIDGLQNGRVWFATAKGLYLFNQNKLTLVLPNHDVRSVRVVQSNGRWQMANGKAQTANSEQQPTANSQQPTEQRIIEQVWCATSDGGLFKIVIDEQLGPLIAPLDVEQGLPSQKAFALWQEKNASGGDVWLIGTNRGLARYETNSIEPLLQTTRVIGKRAYTQEEIKNGLQLEYPQNSLVLEVAGLSSRTFPEQFQYAFKLFNEKGELVQSRLARDAQFSTQGLKPGKYRVEAIAFNSDLQPSQPLAFEFWVGNAPFPWTTALLASLLLLAAVALVWAIFEHRNIMRTSAALASVNQELADARLRLANEAETERRRIARDLHDQTLADLRRLMLMSDQLSVESDNGKKSTVDPTLFRSEIENVSNEIRRICEDLSPSVLENVGFAAALEFALSDAVAHLPEEKKFEYEFACPDDLEERMNIAPGVMMQLYRIAQEAISNVCRHAEAKRVRLAVSITEESAFVLKLEDDGRGFNSEAQTTGRGLANISARASLIDAEVEWTTDANRGTVFVLKKET